MVSEWFRSPQALSSALAALRMLQPLAIGFLNCLITLISASNYYLFYSQEVANLQMYVSHFRASLDDLNNFNHDLLSFCRNVSAGLSHLSRKCFVHRDLAARNILVSNDNVCKVRMKHNDMNLVWWLCHYRLLTLEWHGMSVMIRTTKFLEERYQ